MPVRLPFLADEVSRILIPSHHGRIRLSIFVFNLEQKFERVGLRSVETASFPNKVLVRIISIARRVVCVGVRVGVVIHVKKLRLVLHPWPAFIRSNPTDVELHGALLNSVRQVPID